MGSLPNQQRPLSRVHVCAPGEIFSAESVKPRDLDRAPQRCKKTSTRHKSSKKSQKMPCKVLMRVLILYMAFLWWEKKYPVLRGTEQKPVDPKINPALFSAPEARGFKGLPEGAERVPQRRFTSWEGLRQHPLPNGGLKIGQHADEQGHGDAVPEGEAEEVAFLPDHAVARWPR